MDKTQIADELWKDVLGYEHKYMVSNLGRVLSLEREVVSSRGQIIHVKRRILKQRLDKTGCFTVSLCSQNKKRKERKVHILVAQAFLDDYNKTLGVDHKDRNRLNNLHTNLRMSTQSQNGANSSKKCGSSKYKGVWFRKDSNKWRSSIKYEYKTINLGSFAQEISAAKAYDKKALELFGAFACTNEMLGLYEEE